MREGLGLNPHRGLVVPLPSAAHVSQESSRFRECLLGTHSAYRVVLVLGRKPSKDILIRHGHSSRELTAAGQ